jgi:hypothetical protein
MAKVRAIKEGFYGGSRRRVGDVFEFSGKKLGKWMVPADAKAVTTEEAKEAPPAGTADAVRAAHKAKSSGKEVKAEAKEAPPAGGDSPTGNQEVI